MKHQPYVAVGLVIAALSVFAGVVGALEARAELPADAGDLSTATRTEVKDASSQVLFSGQFGEVVQKGDERERKAMLIGSGASTCEAEIEIESEAGGARQELEVDVKGVAPGSSLTVSVDDRPLGSFRADAKGEGGLELSGAVGR